MKRLEMHEALRLMKAAPEMLEALRMVRDADEDCRRDGLRRMPSAARARIDAAIAKAEGRLHVVPAEGAHE